MIGTVGFQDVHCKTINVTYVKTESVELHSTLLEYVKQFRKQYTNGGSKTINLELFQKKRGRWPFSGEEQIPWEVWSLSFVIMNKDEKQSPSESVISVFFSFIYDLEIHLDMSLSS